MLIKKMIVKNMGIKRETYGKQDNCSFSENNGKFLCKKLEN